jgi:electron transfer flavoprotein beta subunit
VIATSFEDNRIVATRRLDGGRREVLDVRAPAVISVEGATARLRRASLTAMRTAAISPIEVVTPTVAMRVDEFSVHPYRPRARALASPSGVDALDRVRSLTATGTAAASHDVETLAPTDAAARIVRALTDWGYL